mgnify:CR=1 FL=1
MDLREAALLRTLRDIAHGHLNLWVDVRYFDEANGQPHAVPQVVGVSPDRAPAGALAGPEWWSELVDAGWLRPPAAIEAQRYHPTDAAIHLLRESGLL